ncbi:molybdopterin-dependent oxidoreductase [Lysinimonas soli]|uniref:Molybdopterin-dependent oxidoreductase n=1 Tax=Lysinimonas soli TaxID=1074233 RepID=A0ABW0NSV6_9MICO
MSDRPPAPRRLLGQAMPAVAGLASVILGLGVAELVAAAVAPTAGPLLVVGSQLIDWAPAWAKQVAIALFGTGDKAALLTGVGVVLALVSAGAGVLERRRPPIGRLLIGALGVFGAGAAIARSGSSLLDVIPAAVATVVAVLALGFLLRRLAEPVPARPVNPATLRTAGAASGPSTADAAARLTRRRFLGLSAGAVTIGALSALGGYALQAGSRAATAARNAFRLPTPSVAAPAVPAGAELAVAGLTPVVTPNADFYRIDTALQVPQLNPDDWQLKITGLVEHPVTLGWAELIALPLEESYTTLMCVSNEVGGDLIGTAKWLGYPIRHLLARAAPTASADMVLSRSSDGFTASTPLVALLEADRNAILAIGMNDEPLPAEHGSPVRMVVPGLYGYVSATKWVVELEVTRFADHAAYWTERGWSDHGPIKLESRIDVPRQGTIVSRGQLVVAGVAWHQHTGISKVEVQVDDGPWNEATLATAISVDTWVQWRWTWNASSGTHKLRVRATDAAGEVQTSQHADVIPDGATGYHEVDVQVA